MRQNLRNDELQCIFFSSITLIYFFSYMILHVSMPFSQIFPPSPSATESIRLFYKSMSLLLSRTQGYCYHLSKFHIYALVYCIGVFLSGWLHSNEVDETGDILLIYCNNQLKNYITPLLRLERGGTLHPPSDVYVRSFLWPFFTLIKPCYTKALEWSRLVPGP